MNLKLSDEDRRAIDVFLDRSTVLDGDENGAAKDNGNGLGHRAAFGVMSAKFQHRMQAVERILNTFGAMRAPEPPPDLLRRTLRAIDERAAQRAAPADLTDEQPSQNRPGA